MAKIYQNFEDVGVAVNVLYAGSDAGEQVNLPNGDRVVMSKTGTGGSYKFGLFHDAKCTRPVYNSELEKLFVKGFVVRIEEDFVAGTMGDIINSYAVPKELMFNYSNVKYYRGSSEEPTSKNVHCVTVEVTQMDPTLESFVVRTNEHQCVAFPDPVE